MTSAVRSLAGTLTLAAVLLPSTTVVWTVVHLVLDAHHHEAVSATGDRHHDAAAVLHGHHHDPAFPAHGHETTAPVVSHQLPSPTPMAIHPSMTASLSATLTAEVSFVARFEPSPPQLVPTILRI